MKLFNATINPLDFIGFKIVKATTNQLKKAGVNKTYKYRDNEGNFFTVKAFNEIKEAQKREINKQRALRNKPKKQATKAAQVERKSFVSTVKDFFNGFKNEDDFFKSEGFFNQYSLDNDQREFYKILSKIDDFNHLTKHGKYKVIESLSKPATQVKTGLNIEGGLLSKKRNVGFKQVLEIRSAIELNKENGYKKGSICTKEQANFMADKLKAWHIAEVDYASIYGSDVV